MPRILLRTLLLAALPASFGFSSAAEPEQSPSGAAVVVTRPLLTPGAERTVVDAPRALAAEPGLPAVAAPQAPRPGLPVARGTNLAQQSSAAASSGEAGEKVAQAAPAASTGLPVPAQSAVPPPPRFDIERFDVQGNSLLDEREVQQAVEPHTGKSKDFSDVQRALESLQNRYQAQGFGAVQVLLPEQELERGVIVLRVIEPRLARITIEGNKFFDEDNIRRSVPGLKEGTTPNAATMGRSVRLANENPAKRTTVLLREGASESEIDATVRVQDEKFWRGSVSLDNTGSPSSGMYRLGFAFQHSNMFNLDHVLTLQYVLDPEPIHKFDELKVLGIAYRVPLYERGASMDFLFGYSDLGPASNQVISGSAFNIAGSGTIVGARYNQLLPRVAGLGDYEHKVSFGLDYKAFSNQVLLVDLGPAAQNLTPDVTVYPFSIAYSATKRMENSELGFYGSIANNIYPHGPDAYREKFNAPITDPIPGIRPGVGRPGYTVWRYGANFVQAFPNDVQFRANITGQWSRDALVPGEQFGIGGWDSIRGMHEREAANDRGYRGSVEIYSPDLAPKMELDGSKLRLLAFVDWGSLRQNFQPPPGQCVGTSCGLSAASVGVGLRMSLRQGFSLRLDYGQLLDGGATGERGDDRWHFGMAVAF